LVFNSDRLGLFFLNYRYALTLCGSCRNYADESNLEITFGNRKKIWNRKRKNWRRKRKSKKWNLI